ncbi:hypothetical protein R1sor_015909 [Riccia sorocarpa]|uniref:Pyruvate kinase C-terminal domain-containing protein n=1 Tax=Riccia sorocarpa TaxID=122646 RepID=A0ABD3HHK4_9MARC
MRNIMRTLAYRSFLLHFLSVFQSKSAAQLQKWPTSSKSTTIFVYTRRGYMAQLLSRCRSDCPIFSFTEEPKNVRRWLNLSWGLIPFRVDFSEDMEKNLRRTFSLLKAERYDEIWGSGGSCF